MSTRKGSRRAATAGVESVIKAEAETTVDGPVKSGASQPGQLSVPPNFPVYLHFRYKLARSGQPQAASLRHILGADNQTEIPFETPLASQDDGMEESEEARSPGELTAAEKQAIRVTAGLPEEFRKKVLGDTSRAQRHASTSSTGTAGAGGRRSVSSTGEEEAPPERPPRRARGAAAAVAASPSSPSVKPESATGAISTPPSAGSSLAEPAAAAPAERAEPPRAAVAPPLEVPQPPPTAAVGLQPPAISGSTEVLPPAQQEEFPTAPAGVLQPQFLGAGAVPPQPALAGVPGAAGGGHGALPQPAIPHMGHMNGSGSLGTGATPHRGRGRPPKDPVAHAAIVAERERQRAEQQAEMDRIERHRHEARLIREAQSIQDTAGIPMAMMPQPPQVAVPPQHPTIQVPVVAAQASLQHAVKLREMFLTSGPPPMPPCPWFDPEGIQEQEVGELKVCFPRLRAQSPVDPHDHDNVAYVTLRNTLIDVYRANADQKLTLAECRKHCDGDLSTLIRVLSFLERNALVNFALKTTPLLGPYGQPQASQTTQAQQQQTAKLKANLKEQWGQTPRCTACGRVCLYSFFVLAPGVYGSILPALPQLRPSVWCGDCAREAPYSNCLSKVSLPALHITGEVANWSETQLTTLFDAIESYGTDWLSVSRAVSGVPGNPVRSPSDCLAAFLAMPIAEPTHVPLIPQYRSSRRLQAGGSWESKVAPGKQADGEGGLMMPPRKQAMAGPSDATASAAQLTHDILSRALELLTNEQTAGSPGSPVAGMQFLKDPTVREKILRDLQRRVEKARAVAITAAGGSPRGGGEPAAGLQSAAPEEAGRGQATADLPMAMDSPSMGSVHHGVTEDVDLRAAQLLSPTLAPAPPPPTKVVTSPQFGTANAEGSPHLGASDVPSPWTTGRAHMYQDTMSGVTPNRPLSASPRGGPTDAISGVSFHPPSSTGSSSLTTLPPGADQPPPAGPMGDPAILLQGIHRATPPSSTLVARSPCQGPGSMVSLGQPVPLAVNTSTYYEATSLSSEKEPSVHDMGVALPSSAVSPFTGPLPSNDKRASPPCGPSSAVSASRVVPARSSPTPPMPQYPSTSPRLSQDGAGFVMAVSAASGYPPLSSSSKAHAGRSPSLQGPATGDSQISDRSAIEFFPPRNSSSGYSRAHNGGSDQYCDLLSEEGCAPDSSVTEPDRYRAAP